MYLLSHSRQARRRNVLIKADQTTGLRLADNLISPRRLTSKVGVCATPYAAGIDVEAGTLWHNRGRPANEVVVVGGLIAGCRYTSGSGSRHRTGARCCISLGPAAVSVLLNIASETICCLLEPTWKLVERGPQHRLSDTGYRRSFSPSSTHLRKQIPATATRNCLPSQLRYERDFFTSSAASICTTQEALSSSNYI